MHHHCNMHLCREVIQSHINHNCHMQKWHGYDTCSYRDGSIFVWSNLACMDATFGRAGLIASTTCLSVRAIGTVLPEPEPVDNAIDIWLLVGEFGIGVPGCESSVWRNRTNQKQSKTFMAAHEIFVVLTCWGGRECIAMCAWMPRVCYCWHPKCLIHRRCWTSIRWT